jgi:ADP-heptose:LPS heptosyltransferase
MNKTFTIIQLTRLGDLVQTYQAASELKKFYPDLKLKLIARSQFAKPLNFLLSTIFDEIIPIDIHSLLSNDLEEYIENIHQWLDQPSLKEIDVLINLSFCEASNYLSTLIDAEHKLGTRIDDNNQVIVKDQWSQVIYAMVMGGPYCPFSLVDLYKNILGITPSFIEKPTYEKVKNIKLAIHPFASDTKKHWKHTKWTEVLYKFLKDNENAEVHIFGAKNESQKVELITATTIIKKYSNRIYNHVGKLSLEETYLQLGKCSHFIGHDSLLGHLAKVSGLPTLTIALGTVRPIETTPYGPRSYVLSPRSKCFPCFPDTPCSFYQCHANLSYQATSSILNQFTNNEFIDEKTVYNETSSFHLDSLDIHEFGQSSSGWFTLSKLGDDSPLYRDFIRDIYRVAFSFKLEEIEEKFNYPNLSREHIVQIEHIQKGIEQYYELCEFGKKYSKFILLEISKKDPQLELIKNYADKVDEVDRLQELLKQTYSELVPIIDFYKVMKFNLHGENIVELSESSYVVYNDNSIMCSILHELFGQTIDYFQKKFGIKATTKDGNA